MCGSFHPDVMEQFGSCTVIRALGGWILSCCTTWALPARSPGLIPANVHTASVLVTLRRHHLLVA